MFSKNAKSSKFQNIVVVDLEPTPYKTDLWNAVVESGKTKLLVIYTEARNFAPDGGHNYTKWPKRSYHSISMPGKGISAVFGSVRVVLTNIFARKPDLLYIAGYDRLATLAAIIWCSILRVRFVVHADQFNLGMPPGCFSSAKFVVREIIRKLIFSRALAILVCGRKGVDSALEAGCKAEKVIDFPYVIDISRMLSEKPTDLPLDCKSDVDSKKLIIMFSGRMIPRKGLETLIRTLPKLKKVDRDWILWIEGDGPELAQYENLAEELGVVDRCRFLGFCQFDSHGWLMSSCHIVVVPSLEDTWGIIVDEGLQLGKLVIASNAVGSGYDRIQSGINGYIFPTGNIDRLGDLLEEIIQNIDLRTAISEAAVVSSKIIRPQDNAEKLINLL